MKSFIVQAFIIYFIAQTFVSCTTTTNKKPAHQPNDQATQTAKNDYELADDLVQKLKNEGADTIIFYKRTCISCCDFFNIFWSSNGRKLLYKICAGLSDMRTHPVPFELKQDMIFSALDKNYDELKHTSIKGNSHKQKDGTSTSTSIDHYCYAEMKIYTQSDSIITGRIEDHFFDKYTGFGAERSEKNETNDSYLENNNSKWNVLLITIENQLANMPETSSRELQTLRTKTTDQ